MFSRRQTDGKNKETLVEDNTENFIQKRINNDLMMSIPADVIYMAVTSLKTSRRADDGR